MRKIFGLMGGVFLLGALSGCSSDSGASRGTMSNSSNTQVAESQNSSQQSTEASSRNQPTPATDETILVAFFSRSGENYNVGYVERGNTELLAEMIHDQVGGDLFQIETVETYPESYDSMTEIAQEERTANARPELATTIENPEQYDVIYLGYPIWWADMPMAMYTFLETYDFSGKTIIPFSTNEGSNLASTISSVQTAQPDATVLDGFTIRGQMVQEEQDEASNRVNDWLENISY
ncbi:flavodoxin [Enterococcus sp. LJL120]